MASFTYAKYLDHVLGAWLGAFMGAGLGAARQGQKHFEELKFDTRLLGKAAPTDTISLALLAIHALKERGPHLTSKGLTEEWQQHFLFESAQYGIARRNWRLGIASPASGRHNNDFFGESVSAAARAVVWGLVSPGAPKTAVRYARRDAELDHHGDGVEAAMFVAAFVASAFFEANIETLTHTSLHQIEGVSRFARMVRDVLRWTGERTIEECIGLVRSRYATPDYSRALANVGFGLVQLLKHKGSFESSVLGVAGCGYDALRNGALVGAIAGVLAGASRLPAKWTGAMGDKFGPIPLLKDFATDGTLASVAEDTCRLGMEIASVFDSGADFAQVPPQVTVLEHNPMFVRVMDLFVEYPGGPSLRFGDERDVRLKIVSRNPRRMQGVFRLETKSDIVIRPDAFPIDLGPYETRTIDAKVAFDSKAQRLAMANLVTATFAIGKDVIHAEAFGVSGSAQWLALGPFWEESRAARPEAWAAPFSHGLGFERKWLTEPDVDEKTKPKSGLFFDRAIVHADSDVIPLDAAFPPTGPCTLYLVARLHSPADRKAVIWLGSNDAVKCWVNKKLAIESDVHLFFTPFNHIAEIKLSKGTNRLLLKVARRDRHFALRIGFKESAKIDSFGSAWLTDLAFERFDL